MFWKAFMGDLDSLPAPQLLLFTVLALVPHSSSSSEISLTEVMKITALFFTRFHPNSPGRQKSASTQKNMTSTLISVILVFHPHPSSAEVKERVELYLCSPSGPSWPVLG
jgi:hypothetical protein